MKKGLFLILALCVAFAANAQKISKAGKYGKIAVEKVKPYVGTEIPANSSGIVTQTKVPQGNKDFAPVIIGSTVYDLQSNAYVPRRIVRHGDGTMSAVWTRGMEAGSFPDRGTGFNFYDGSAWATAPEARIEEDVRTGWPTITDNGTNDVVIPHGSVWLHKSTNTSFGADDWTTIEWQPTTDMPSPTWPRATQGGPDGQTIHLIATNYQEVWHDIEGNLGYFRSTDGGANWDIGGEPFDEITSDKYGSIGGDSYAIDALGETVAILVSVDYGDLFMLKSTDNGDSWTKTVILDFPDELEPFDYTTDIIDLNNDGVPDSVITADGVGSIVIDPTGKVHCAFGLIYNFPEGGSSYYRPASDGLVYWNEDMGEGVHSMDYYDDGKLYMNSQLGEDNDTLFMSPDLDGDDTIHEYAWEEAGTETPFGIYFHSITGQPQLIAGEDHIVMYYTTVMEGYDYAKLEANPAAQNYRHIWAAVRYDNGTWSEPIHVTTGDDFKLYEHVFPMACRNTTVNAGSGLNNAMFFYQMDDEPGMHIRGDEDPNGTTNYLMAVSMDLPEAIHEISSDNSDFKMYPNPANNTVEIESELNAAITIYNIVGSEVMRIENAQENQSINIAKLPEGTYIVKVKTSAGVTADKLIVR